MDTQNKKSIRVVAIILAALIAILIGVLVWFGTSYKAPDSSEGFLPTNPDPLSAVTPQTAEERHEEQEALPSAPASVEGDIYEVSFRRLSTGDLTGLNSYLRDLVDSYSDPELRDRAEDMRADLANIRNMDPDSAIAMFQSFRDPITLAAAVAYTPISYKLEAFRNADSYIFPAPPEGTDIRLKASELTGEEKQRKLDSINEGKISYDQFSDIDAFDMTLYDRECRLWVTKGEYGWVPYLMESADGTKLNALTQVEVRELAAASYGSGGSIDDIICYN